MVATGSSSSGSNSSSVSVMAATCLWNSSEALQRAAVSRSGQGPKLMKTLGRSVSLSRVPRAPGKALTVQSPSCSQSLTKSLSRPALTVHVPCVQTSLILPSSAKTLEKVAQNKKVGAVQARRTRRRWTAGWHRFKLGKVAGLETVDTERCTGAVIEHASEPIHKALLPPGSASETALIALGRKALPVNRSTAPLFFGALATIAAFKQTPNGTATVVRGSVPRDGC